jgi:hypothetical protein
VQQSARVEKGTGVSSVRAMLGRCLSGDGESVRCNTCSDPYRKSLFCLRLNMFVVALMYIYPLDSASNKHELAGMQ